MKDKYEQAAKGLQSLCDKLSPLKSVSDRENELIEFSAYLREQFPGPKPIEGVRELVESFDPCARGDYISDADIERLITDFIEKREAGKWIPVTPETMPEDRKTVYLLRKCDSGDEKYDHLENGYHSPGGWWNERGNPLGYKPDTWHELPPAPKE